jgi:hypothetical protein
VRTLTALHSVRSRSRLVARAQAFESSLHALTFDPLKARAEDLMVRAAQQDEKMKFAFSALLG